MCKALKAAGLSPHCLRHTFASLLLQLGESPAHGKNWFPERCARMR